VDRTKDKDVVLELVALSEELATTARSLAETISTEDSGKSGGESSLSTTVQLLFSSIHQHQQQQLSSSEEDMFGGIHSQDSFADHLQQQQSSKPRTNKLKRVSSVNSTSSQVLASSTSGWYDPTVVLVAENLIVEKMNIHYGQKAKNPVDHMRFFAKDCDPQKEVARQLSELNYATSLPRVFEECALRVYCRDASKVVLARHVYVEWCKRQQSQQTTPFPSLSQNHVYFEEEEEEVVSIEGEEEEEERSEMEQDEGGSDDEL
jgi:hypothetical protein